MRGIRYAGSPMELGAIVPLPMAVDPTVSCAPIAGEPPVVRAVRALLDAVAAVRVVVVVADPFVTRVRDVLVAHGVRDVAVSALPASGDRPGAIRMGLDYLAHEPLSSAPVLVHDVRHPLVPGEVIDRVVAGLRAGHPIVVPVVPVTDSVKSVDERGVVVATVDRATLLSVQYPRGFTASTLAELVAQGAAEDELDAALAAARPVTTVDGHADAVRFTLPQDAALLEAIIVSRR
jgi:2-C-methyl-D-erythritol 4-phosphate cytidylyltransferase